MEPFDDKAFSEKMSLLYMTECEAARVRLKIETECRRVLVESYEQVLDKAKEYSKKIEAPILAKISGAGFFCDAHVVRTNQLTLEMGANYYTECSIGTAEKIVSRRIAELQKTRKNGLDTIRVLEEKMKFAEENFSSVSVDGGPLEIMEKYDEEMEKKFWENRKKRKENKELTTQEKEEVSSNNVQHDEIMSRLEELEKIEMENEEIEVETKECPTPKPFEFALNDDLGKLQEIEEDEDDESASDTSLEMKERLLAQPGVSRKEMERLLQYLDDCDIESSDDYDDEEEEEDTEVVEEKVNKVEELDSDDYASDENAPVDSVEVSKPPTPKVVEIEQKSTEKNSKRKTSGVRFAEQLEKVKTFLQTDTVEVKQETTIETKSILRNTTPTPVDRSALEPEQKELAAMSSVTFPGEVVEKNPYECEPSTSKDPAPVITEKKVSKFRASRHKN
ncbi:unnamed protein product [Caenorhabditis brenneri]